MIGGGMSHRFMGRGGGVAPRRYIFDEISGGQNGYGLSHLSSSYLNNSVQLNGTNPYGFIDGYADKASMLTDFPSNTRVSVFYNQINATSLNNGITNEARWIPADDDLISFALGVGDGMGNVLFTSGTAFNSPRTYVVVLKRTTATPVADEVILTYRGIGSSNRQIFYFYQRSGGGLTLLFRDLDGTSGTQIIQWPGFTDLNRKMIIIDFDGVSTTNLYLNDMSTPLTISSGALVGAPSSLTASRFFIGSFSGLEVKGYINEVIEFNKVLSLAERQTAKEILEQYYTFS